MRLLEPPVSCGACGGEGWVESKRPGLFRLCACRTDAVLRPSRVCSIEGCEYSVKANKLCHAHNARLQRGQDLNTPIRRRTKRFCDAPGCKREHHSGGWCAAHYRRTRNGVPVNGRSPRHLWFKDGETGCWVWVARLDKDGYGLIDLDNRTIRAHRWMYAQHAGDIPEGMTVDHICFVRSCVNPDHLRLLSHAENARMQRSALKTHCVHGHEYTDANTYLRRDGGRDCRACIRDRAKKYQSRKSACGKGDT